MDSTNSDNRVNTESVMDQDKDNPTLTNEESSETIEPHKQRDSEKSEKSNDLKLSDEEFDKKSVDECKSSNLEEFKKPSLLIGPRKGKTAPLRLLSVKISIPQQVSNECEPTNVVEEPNKSEKNNDYKQLPFSYKEPAWGGTPTAKYKMEVLKSGVILNVIDLSESSFYVIGRLPVCDIPLAHPTISRYHAILQYRIDGDDKDGPGYYLYDLESTHGTFWNGCRIRPKTYVRLRGGHMIKFGCSQRKFILQTPVDEEEEESEYSLTELKEMRRLELLEREREEKSRDEEMTKLEEEQKEKEEAEGINWGMGEDADEESDMTENPYAMTNNEELFLDDPKKTLRGWFEREGYDLQYQTEEKGLGQFLCWVELPIEASTNGSVRAEALVKGKKKEAVAQCALEACRVLDRHGLLRQATHEGRKRKSRNWEEEDYYDSDEDNFLDRTGTIERKREQRMRNAGKIETKAETYTSLMQKHSIVVREISKIEITLKNHDDANKNVDTTSNVDALDAFMSNLNAAVLNKNDVIKLKMKLQTLRKDEESLRKLVNITKPANLPSLSPSIPVSSVTKTSNSPQKRLRVDDNQIDNSDNSNEKSINYEQQPESESKHNRYGLIELDEVTEEENIIESNDKNDEKNSFEESKEEITQNSGNSDNETKTIKSDNVNDDEMKDNESSEAQITKSKKRNLQRKQQRAEQSAKSQMSTNEEKFRENYSNWLPPEGQTGDGRTSLNDKFGY